jgi:tRNA 2-thiouridine synthesizing protein C
MIQKHLAFIFTAAPYASQTAREGLEAVIAASIFDQRLSLVFIGDGVFQLIKKQIPDTAKNHAKMLQALSVYDINDCYVHAKSMEERNLTVNQFCIDTSLIDDHDLQTLLATAHHTLSF